MKTLIIYSSRFGNTRKMAQALSRALPGDNELISITELPVSGGGYDLVVVGFPIMAGRVEPRAARFLAGLDEKVKLFLFMTHGSAKSSALVDRVMKTAVSLVKTAEVVGHYSCRGEVNPKVLDKLGRSATPPEWLAEAADSQGHPDSADQEALAALVKKTLATIG